MNSIDLPLGFLAAAELVRGTAFVLALVIGFVPGFRYAPIRPFAFASGIAIAIDAWRRLVLWPAMDAPGAAPEVVLEAWSADLAGVLCGLLLPASCAWVTFMESDEPLYDFAGWGVLWAIVFVFFRAPYPLASWSVDPGFPFALSVVVHLTLAPGVVAFWTWTRRKRAPRVEHRAALGILLAHVGLCVGPYRLIAPNPYGAHEAYSVVLYGLAFVAAVGGEVLWIRERFFSGSSRRS